MAWYENYGNGFFLVGEDENGEFMTPTGWPWSRVECRDGGIAWSIPDSWIKRIELRLRILSSMIQGKLVGLESGW